MTHMETQPVEVLHDGPLFSDELEGYPQDIQQFRADNELEGLRLVPTKSAASGVHTIYFRPQHRNWALVRLAQRYRWAIEIQLLRGMSGERQLLSGGFSVDDLGFLYDIVPEPPVDYSPVVYDMLWLAATYDEYLRLSRAIRHREEFRPREVLIETAGVDLDGAGFFTRFLRSHLIRESVERSEYTTRGSNPESGELSIDIDALYEVTDDGRESLHGVVEEYERILECGEFDPLLVDDGQDPVAHLRGVNSGEHPGSTSGDAVAAVAESFGPSMAADEEPGDSGDRETVRASDGGMANERPGPARPDETDAGPTPGKNAEATDGPEYSDEEIRAGVEAACTLITEENVARATEMKEAVWGAVDRADRSKAELWEAVVAVLLETDVVNGRPSGRVWTARSFSREE
ncbi:MAG: hypothetical protein V5A49_04760 [Haloarcula sp.]